MKKNVWIVWLLIITMCVSMFSGCKKTEPVETDPVATTSDVVADTEELANAIEYVKTIYKDVSEKTPVDFDRIGVVRVGTNEYTIVWSVDVGEEYIKIVVNADGTVTIDVDENCTEMVEYVLTATITDADGNTASVSWNHVIPGGASLEEMQAIVDMAYALDVGESLDEEYTLKGVITSIDTVWSDQYQNITVTMAVEGREDKTIQCYRLKGDGAKDLVVGDTISVQGILTNYNGTIEFTAGCQLLSVEKTGVAIEIPSDPNQIMEDIYALGANESLPYGPVTLTGNICSIDESYSEQYDNITVTIQIGWYTIKCYRMSGDGVEDLEMNDIITVQGYAKKYNGTRELDKPTLLDVVKVGAYPQPKDQVEVVTAAYNLDPGWTLPYSPVTLTGTITTPGTWSDQYENVNVTFVVEGAENMPILCYRMTYSDDATKASIKSLAKGDVITVKGMLVNYQNTKTGKCTVEFNYPELISVTKATIDSDSTAPLLTSKPKDGDTLIFVNLETAMSKNASGSKMGSETAVVASNVLAVTSNMARVKVSVDSDGYYTFTVGGKYLTSGSTGNSLTLESAAGNYSKWILEDAGGGAWYIKSVNAVYSGYNQYVETYNGEYTTFSKKETSDSKYYKIFFYVSSDDGTSSGGSDDSGSTETENVYMNTAPKNGDKVVIVAPAYNKALSTQPASSGSFYQKGVDVTASNGKLTGYADTEIWTVIVNDDGSYSFANGDKNIGLAASYSSMSLGAINDDWTVAPLGNNLFTIRNVVRSNYIEWYSSKGNWSSYNSSSAATDDQFQLAFYLVEAAKEPSVYMETAPANGDQVVIVAPAYNKALSTQPASSGSFYQKGVDVTASNGKLTGYADTEVWTVIVNDDGSYSFANGGKNIGLAASYSSMSLGAVNDDWTVAPLGNNLFTIRNVARSNYIEWYSSKGNWSSYNSSSAATDDQFQLAFYLVSKGSGSTTPPVTDTDPTPDTELTISEALELGASKSSNSYTTGKYYITGSVTNIASETYGNITIEDEAGNSILIWGVYSADGSTRYDSMNPQPKVGDTVKAYGVIGQYSGTAQMKNAWVTITASENDDEDEGKDDGNKGSAYVKISSASELTTGSYVLVASNGCAPTTYSSGWVLTGTPSVEDGSISTDNASGFVWTISVSGSSVTITDANGATIKPKGGNNNGVSSGSYSWTVVDNGDGTFSFKGVGSDTVTFACNTDATNGLNRFRGYKNTTVSSNTKTYLANFTLYKLVEA